MDSLIVCADCVYSYLEYSGKSEDYIFFPKLEMIKNSIGWTDMWLGDAEGGNYFLDQGIMLANSS